MTGELQVVKCSNFSVESGVEDWVKKPGAVIIVVVVVFASNVCNVGST